MSGEGCRGEVLIESKWGDSERALQALKDAGYLTAWRIRPRPGGQEDDLDLTLTPKGEAVLRQGNFMGTRSWEFNRCDVAASLEVTGITTNPGGVTATAELTVAPSALLRLIWTGPGMKDQHLDGEAYLRRYDDGCRVQGMKVKGGLP